jgi:endonuclease YncB( thermonuclease family)
VSDLSFLTRLAGLARLARLARLVVLVVAIALPAVVNADIRVIEGDVLEVDGERFRLVGIDAPHLDQNCLWPNKVIPCGRIAVTALLDLIAAAKVVCKPVARANADGPRLARCAADGFDIGGNMVHTGWALALPGTQGRYADIQRDARAGKRGLWRGAFVRPWDWAGKAAAAADSVIGKVEAGVECPAFRSDQGDLYSLLGLAGRAMPESGACVCGRRAPVSHCMRGTTLTVATLHLPKDCPKP